MDASSPQRLETDAVTLPAGSTAHALPEAAALVAALHGDARSLGRRNETVGPDGLSARDRYGWALLRLASRPPAQGTDDAPADRGVALRPHYRDLVQLDGAAFVAASFRLLLRRAPDEEGLAHYAACLAAGRSKIEIIREIIASPEGRWKQATLRGLPIRKRLFRRTVELPPVLSRLALLGARPAGPSPAPPPAAGTDVRDPPMSSAPWADEMVALRREIERLSGALAMLARTTHDGAPPATSADPSAIVAGSIRTLHRRLDRRQRLLHVEVTLRNVGVAAWLPRTLAPLGGVALGARLGRPGGPGFGYATDAIELPQIVPRGGSATVAGVLTLPAAGPDAPLRPERWTLDLVWRGGWLGAPDAVLESDDPPTAAR